jgi:lectin, mannose-binding 2
VFEFKIHGKGTSIYGDGMAMWITKQRAQKGTVFGFTDRFEGLGVFIDTYKNGRAGTTFPYVMAMLGDGHTVYDNDNDGKANDIGGCSVRACLG